MSNYRTVTNLNNMRGNGVMRSRRPSLEDDRPRFPHPCETEAEIRKRERPAWKCMFNDCPEPHTDDSPLCQGHRDQLNPDCPECGARVTDEMHEKSGGTCLSCYEKTPEAKRKHAERLRATQTRNRLERIRDAVEAGAASGKSFTAESVAKDARAPIREVVMITERMIEEGLLVTR